MDYILATIMIFIAANYARHDWNRISVGIYVLVVTAWTILTNTTALLSGTNDMLQAWMLGTVVGPLCPNVVTSLPRWTSYLWTTKKGRKFSAIFLGLVLVASAIRSDSELGAILLLATIFMFAVYQLGMKYIRGFVPRRRR